MQNSRQVSQQQNFFKILTKLPLSPTLFQDSFLAVVVAEDIFKVLNGVYYCSYLFPKHDLTYNWAYFKSLVRQLNNS